MKAKKIFRSGSFFIVTILLVCLVFSLQNTVQAQDGEDPPPPKKKITEPFQPRERFDSVNGKEEFRLPAANISADQNIQTLAVTGEPGLSYRYVETFGVTEEAYLASSAYINRPTGLYIDGSDNLFVTEEYGCRVLKYSSVGANLLYVGRTGLCFTDDEVLNNPADIAVDAGGNIWVADKWSRVAQYDASGVFQQNLPENNSWESGNDNTHFDAPQSVVFDSSGRMMVSDRYNHRIQVYTFSGGTPVYNATIGETGVSGSDNSHFDEPYGLAIDSSDRLYIVDRNNNRVQRCTDSGGWSCTTFASGFDWPRGIDVDSGDNVYIADGNNYRVRKCTSSGTCSDIVTSLSGYVADVAVDSTGNIYVSDWTYNVVRKYNSSGVSQGVFVGTVDTPYVADTSRMNTPSGIVVASDGSIYYTEDRGDRLIKMNSTGVQQWTVGQAGVYGNNNAHFGSYWAGPQGSVALDSAGRVYVPDFANHRIQVFSSNGFHYTTFGSWGTGNSNFDGPSGVAINPTNGDIYVVDRHNHRVQVYSSSWVYKATLGVTGIAGSDNTHFSYPRGIAVDTNGSVYVADSDNHRVQKCTVTGSSGTCITFAGQAGVDSDEFGYFSNPIDIALDDSGHVFIADEWNNRVQVYDSAGAYLTTIGGNWGMNTSQFRNASGVAVDSAGNVYITDATNARIQKFSPDIIDWKQTNINGFGSLYNQFVLALTPFDGQLYVWNIQSTWNWNATLAL